MVLLDTVPGETIPESDERYCRRREVKDSIGNAHALISAEAGGTPATLQTDILKGGTEK